MRPASLLLVMVAALAACSRAERPFVVASKPFTESELLGEMLATLLEEKLKQPVTRKLHLGGSVCLSGIKTGDVDAYVEYTGTALVNALKEPSTPVPSEAFRRVSSEFERRWGVRWLPPLGFDNTYAVIMRRAHAEKLGVSRISDLRELGRRLRCGFDLEFADRADGYKGLLAHYALEFCSSVTQMAPGLMYQALADGRVDAISGYTTDGRIHGLDLLALEDDQDFFPPYEAAVVLSARALKRHPRAAEVLKELSGRVSAAEMTRLNARVDVEKRPAREVAREFLREEGLLP